jgi:hypothetical protein
MTDDRTIPRALVGLALHDLASETEILLLIAQAIEDQASGISNNASPQRLRETAVLVKSAALQLGMAAANIVGTAERLRIVAGFSDDGEGGDTQLPS